ncbi:hypothetical protein K7432_003595 [Basidiobolus ranarum]|uniref:Uncharacterized protein n=1 Tax=Basidiobolus ranarum TaxID=34480 RepID=A0ABR2W676_9FUNG
MSSKRRSFSKKPEGNSLITNFFGKANVETKEKSNLPQVLVSKTETNDSDSLNQKQTLNIHRKHISKPHLSDDSDLSDSEAIPEFLDDEDDELVSHVHHEHKYEPSVQIEIRRRSLPEKNEDKENLNSNQLVDEAEVEFKPYQFSLNSLLSEKASLDSSGFSLQSLDKILKEKSLLDSNEEDVTMYDTTELSTQILPEEKGMRLAEILASDLNEYQDIKCLFFVNWPQSLPVPKLKLPPSHPFFRVVGQFAKDPESTLTLLKSGLIQLYCDSVETLPPDIYKWLRNIAMYDTNMHCADAASTTLMYALSVTDLHIPLADFIESLKIFGANPEFLDYGFKFIDHLSPVGSAIDGTNASTLEESSTHPPSLPVFNLQLSIRLIVYSIKRGARHYKPEEIHQFIRLLMILLLDNTLTELFYDIEISLNVLLSEFFSEEDWALECRKIVEYIAKCFEGSLRHQIRLLETLSKYSARGKQIRRELSLKFLHLTLDTENPHQMVLERPGNNMWSEVAQMIIDNPRFVIHQDTNYRELYLIVILLDFIFDDEEEMAQSPKPVQMISAFLRKLNGKIVDSKAAFLDRTRVKDIIQRLSVRLFFAVSQVRDTNYQQPKLEFAPSSGGSSPNDHHP